LLKSIVFLWQILLCMHGTLLANSGLYELSYSGCITEKDGRPKKGPIQLDLNFYRSEDVNDAPIHTIKYPDLALAEGVFQVAIQLNEFDAHQVFNGSDPVWIGVEVDGVSYPRQKYMA